MLLMHKLFTVLFFGSECRWLVKPVAAVSGQCSKKPPLMRGTGLRLPRVLVRWCGVISCWWRVVLVLLFVGIAGTGTYLTHIT